MQEVVAGSHDALAALYDRHADAVFAAASRLTIRSGDSPRRSCRRHSWRSGTGRRRSILRSGRSRPGCIRSRATARSIDCARPGAGRPSCRCSLPRDRAGRRRRRARCRCPRTGPGGGPIVAGGVPRRSPEMAVALKELRACLQAALAEMPDVERTVIVLAYGEDLSQSEIAERLGWPLGTVKTRTRRALARPAGRARAASVGPEFTRYLAPVPSRRAGPDRP